MVRHNSAQSGGGGAYFPDILECLFIWRISVAIAHQDG